MCAHRAAAAAAASEDVLVDVGPDTCGCELGIMNRSMKRVAGGVVGCRNHSTSGQSMGEVHHVGIAV